MKKPKPITLYSYWSNGGIETSIARQKDYYYCIVHEDGHISYTTNVELLLKYSDRYASTVAEAIEKFIRRQQHIIEKEQKLIYMATQALQDWLKIPKRTNSRSNNKGA